MRVGQAEEHGPLVHLDSHIGGRLAASISSDQRVSPSPVILTAVAKSEWSYGTGGLLLAEDTGKGYGNRGPRQSGVIAAGDGDAIGVFHVPRQSDSLIGGNCDVGHRIRMSAFKLDCESVNDRSAAEKLIWNHARCISRHTRRAWEIRPSGPSGQFGGHVHD